jgi:glycosyltransferase involved in cell wall biosynthesis
MDSKNLPSISVVFATLNAARVLESCLRSIAQQDYPKNKVEVIIADGGSTDDTLRIIGKFKVQSSKFKIRVVDNPLKTSEAGKAVGVKQATGDFIAFVDSDNILPVKNWFKKMVEPFGDKEIVGSEPIEYTYRKNDPWLTRYFALIGMNDPICLFIGNYDRMSALTGKWTNLEFPSEDKGNYLKIKFDHEPLPTIGANGTLLRRNIFDDLGVGDYLFDIDMLVDIIRKRGKVYFAKVKTGIVHTYVEDDIKKFFRKQ